MSLSCSRLTYIQAQSVTSPNERRYKHTLDACRTIYREEGVGAFYKGLAPSLLGVTHVAVQFPLYEQLKIWAGTSSRILSLSGTDIFFPSIR